MSRSRLESTTAARHTEGCAPVHAPCIDPRPRGCRVCTGPPRLEQRDTPRAWLPGVLADRQSRSPLHPPDVGARPGRTNAREPEGPPRGCARLSGPRPRRHPGRHPGPRRPRRPGGGHRRGRPVPRGRAGRSPAREASGARHRPLGLRTGHRPDPPPDARAGETPGSTRAAGPRGRRSGDQVVGRGASDPRLHLQGK